MSELLELKFGPLGQVALDRLAAADELALQRYGKRLLSATTLEEVFED